MHHIIRLIVYAPTKEEALERAKQTFEERMSGDGKQFDYGTFFDDEDSTIPPVERANSKEGKKLIDEGFDIIKKEHEEQITSMRKMFEKFSNEELFEGKILDKNKEILKELEEKEDDFRDNPYWFKHNCWKISRGDWLFDDDGEAIQNTQDLNRVLNMEYCKNKGDKIWVVPVDVHT